MLSQELDDLELKCQQLLKDTVAEVQRQHQTLYNRADKLEVENKWLRRRVVDMERMVKALQGAMTAGTNISVD